MRMKSLCASLLALASAAIAASQPVDHFYPAAVAWYMTSEVGTVPPAYFVVAHLAQTNATVPNCEGTNDVLALTFSAPILSDVEPSQFVVKVCPIRKPPAAGGNSSSHVSGCPEGINRNPAVIPACATLQPGDEPNERRTVLLLGSFTARAGQNISSGPQGFDVAAFSIQAKGRYLPYVNWTAAFRTKRVEPGDVLSYGKGPFLADISLVDLSAPLNTAAADPNGCAAIHPSATYAVRLFFASAVHERAADGSFAPFGTNDTAAAAMFSLVIGEERRTPSPDRVVGVADVDDDSVVDVCVEGAIGAPQLEAVIINCTAGDLLAPEGFPCDKPIVAEMTPHGGPVQGVIRDIGLCFELDPSDCPSATSGTLQLQSVLLPALLFAVAAALTVADI